ncbi:MAG: energy transducer TonB [Sphingomicrobium sp.]
MYRSNLEAKDRGGAIAAALAVNAALLLAFLHMSGRIDLANPQSAIRVFDINEIPPPPPVQQPPPPQQQRERQKPKEQQGGSPANIRSQATPVVAPKPRVELQRPNPIAVTETPNQGAAPTQGAANVRGPGTGAGGTGTGTGTGSGSGAGDGGAAYPPRLVTPVLRGRDFPAGMLDQWPRGTPVFLRLRVDARGFVSECDVTRGTGTAAIDAVMCNLAHDRLRFRPALNRAGQPVAGWFGYAQPPPR